MVASAWNIDRNLEVASNEALDSFREKCVTKEHPPVLLDASNTKDYALVSPVQMFHIPMAS